MASTDPNRGELLELDIDLRLGTAFWASWWNTAAAEDPTAAALVRLAYGHGYTDAHAEGCRGGLFREHGYPVPRRG